MPRLCVDENSCTDCRICQLVCSARYNGIYSPKLARLNKKAGIMPDTTRTDVCQNCIDAPCVAACPAEALIQSDGQGMVTLDESLCTGCAICVDECPFNAIWFNEETELAYKCELCGGSPECEKRCPTEAIYVCGEEAV